METGLPAPRMRLPDGLIRIVGCGGEVIDLLGRSGPSARVCLETALQAGRTQFFNNAKAREELAWQPLCPIQETVSEAVAWFRGDSEVELMPASPSVESHVR
jgi:nucleoside-diphosphate-sugar epimerase